MISLLNENNDSRQSLFQQMILGIVVDCLTISDRFFNLGQTDGGLRGRVVSFPDCSGREDWAPPPLRQPNLAPS